jgi:hypothetical protein
VFAQGLFWAGIAATFVMGFGTAITLATIAIVVVTAKDVTRRLSNSSEGSGALIMRASNSAPASGPRRVAALHSAVLHHRALALAQGSRRVLGRHRGE